LVASFFLKSENSIKIVWIVFVVGTIISTILLMTVGGLAG
jgi:hypothetical protein